jgi:hypothetical protein
MWCVRLSDCQRDAVRALLEAQGEVGPALTGALEALDLARWDDLPEARLPWERVVEMAAIQGIGEADVVWDLAAGMPDRKRTAQKRKVEQQPKQRRAPAPRPPRRRAA